MVSIVAFVSQKGGVGKSTLSRALAREAAQAGLNVKLADLDTQQGTSVDWHRQRLAAGIEPTVSVESFGTAAQALAIADRYDLLIIDGPARTSAATLDIAKAGIPTARLAFALNRIGTDAEEAEARGYLTEAGYAVLAGCLVERPAYRQAQNTGHSITETHFAKLNGRADVLIQSLIDKATADG